MLTDELITYLFDGKPHPLALPMTEWLSSSRRFTAFVKTFQDKIRKKIRVTEDTETMVDLRLELETSHRLLREKTLSLIYEPQLAEKVRSPDFAVTFTTSLTFMLEVTRLRTEPNLSLNAIHDRLADAVCSKLGQFLAQRSNILLIGLDAPLTEDDLRATMLRIQQRAERQDEIFFQRYRFRDRSDFFSQYRRLSEVLVRGSTFETKESFVDWVNPQARMPLPPKVRTVLYRSQTA